jgi:chromosomal replication initiator protein
MSTPPVPLTPKSDEENPLDAAWQSIRKDLRLSIGARSFDHWLKPVMLAGFSTEDATVRLALPSEFMASWVRSHHGERLAQAWQTALPHVRNVIIEVANERSVERYQAPAEIFTEKASEPAEGFAFDPRLTFSRFIAGPANGVAVHAAKMMAAKGPMRVNPLYIYAQTGQGKTHLLHAIGQEHQRLNPRARVFYMSAERFMFEFVSAMRAKDTISFKTRLRSADMLMIDDVQFIAGKESTQEEFLHTVDELLSTGKQLVISADRAPHALDGVEGRILSRLTQGLVVDIQPADYPLRRAIIGSKAESLENVEIGSDVLDLLASRIATNVRELEGGLNRLAAYAALGNRAITTEFAEEILADMFRASKRRITIDEIQRRVSEHFRIRHAEMVSARRAREVARPRQIAMYLAKQLTPRSLPEIGRRFGGRDHTTVIHAVRQIEKLRAADSEIDNDVRTLMRVLES